MSATQSLPAVQIHQVAAQGARRLHGKRSDLQTLSAEAVSDRTMVMTPCNQKAMRNNECPSI